MGDTYKIKLSSDTISLSKNPLDESRKEYARQIFLANKAAGGSITEDECAEKAKMDVASLRRNEKAFLEALLVNRSNMAKKLCEQRILQDISATIEDAEDSFIIKKTEWDDIVKSYENILEKTGKTNKDGQEVSMPPHWIKLSAILDQLAKPEEVEPDKKEEGK